MYYQCYITLNGDSSGQAENQNKQTGETLMTGFFLQNAVAIITGTLAGIIYYLLITPPDIAIILTTAACGFIGVHLPNIQQPTLLSYRLIRNLSWLASLLIPLALFFYRPIEFALAWVITMFFTHSFWIIIDRISLQRNFTRSIIGITILPLMVTGCAYLTLGAVATLPVFLACNAGYIIFLALEYYLQNRRIPFHPQ